MPDITMCKGKGYAKESSIKLDCHRKETCHRYTATPTPGRQSYFVNLPVNEPEELFDCKHYWNNKE